MNVALGTRTATLSLPPESDWVLLWKTQIEAASAATPPTTYPFTPDTLYDGWYRGPLTTAVPSAGGPAEQPYIQTTYPAPRYDHSSLGTILTDRLQEVVDQLLPVLRAEAASEFVPVTRVEVEGFVDPEEDFEELTITQWVELGPQQAMDYWDRVGTAIQERVDLLPEPLDQIACGRIAIRVAWEVELDAF